MSTTSEAPARTFAKKLFNQADIAEMFSVSPRTLEDWRANGDGPPYYRLTSRCIRYEPAAVERWLQSTQQAARRG